MPRFPVLTDDEQKQGSDRRKFVINPDLKKQIKREKKKPKNG